MTVVCARTGLVAIHSFAHVPADAHFSTEWRPQSWCSTAVLTWTARGNPPARDLAAVQIALAWLLAKPVVTAPIVGATTTRHLEDAIAAVDVTLTTTSSPPSKPPTAPIRSSATPDRGPDAGHGSRLIVHGGYTVCSPVGR